MSLCVSCASGKWSLQELLSARLPNVLRLFGNSRSKDHHDPDWETHPIVVEDGPDWEPWVKDVIRTKTSVSLLSSCTAHVCLQHKTLWDILMSSSRQVNCFAFIDGCNEQMHHHYGAFLFVRVSHLQIAELAGSTLRQNRGEKWPSRWQREWRTRCA